MGFSELAFIAANEYIEVNAPAGVILNSVP